MKWSSGILYVYMLLTGSMYKLFGRMCETEKQTLATENTPVGRLSTLSST